MGVGRGGLKADSAGLGPECVELPFLLDVMPLKTETSVRRVGTSVPSLHLGTDPLSCPLWSSGEGAIKLVNRIVQDLN